jgi:hypothetical protein
MSTEETEEHIHLPPNSWVPICVAFSLAFNFVSYLTFQYPLSGSVSWGEVLVPISAICLIASLVAWFRGARSEYRELPESLDDHA